MLAEDLFDLLKQLLNENVPRGRAFCPFGWGWLVNWANRNLSRTSKPVLPYFASFVGGLEEEI